MNLGLSGPTTVILKVRSAIPLECCALMQNVYVVSLATSSGTPVIVVPTILKPSGIEPEITLKVVPVGVPDTGSCRVMFTLSSLIPNE
jgi:hypothetical protein